MERGYSMINDVYNSAIDTDIATGGVLSAFQDGVMYPSKLLTQSILGNSETGKQWIDFVESNFTLSGARRRREAMTTGDLEIGNGEPTKRLRISDDPSKSAPMVEREVDVNRKMKSRTGRIYQAPRAVLGLMKRGLGRIGDGASAAARLTHISNARARMSSY